MNRMFQSQTVQARALRILVCCDCQEEFVFTVEAQEYFTNKGHFHDPKRCKSCHYAHKHAQGGHAHVQIPSI